jgi:acetylornithine/succinyldiaminopimelate/putrescine aminotransferase/predicted amino acid dehydrogenase
VSAILPPGDEKAAYARFLRPRVAEMLAAIRLDVVYDRARGDYIYHRDANGEELRVLDMLGGYGASLCGHNHPALIAIARVCLAAERPFNAQASVRGQAGLLAARLAERVGRATGKDYVVTLASTGTEAVEAAIKHAELEAVTRLDARRRAAEDGIRRVRIALRQGARLPAELASQAGKLLGLLRAPPENELWNVLRRAAVDATTRPPLFLAVEGSFHGKTTGSLSFTYGAEYRDPWARLGLRSRFLPLGDEAALEAALRAEAITYPVVDVTQDGQIRLLPARFTNVAAAFAEPIQGEGGIRELSPVYLAALRHAADHHGFPLVLDEIQCGLGRTGRFLASEAARVRGDYVLLSKALGGGLAKLSALLVERERYQPDFGYLHTSTFADDDYSSAIGMGVLDLVDADDGALLRACHQKGDHLMAKLRALRERFPDELAAVRGRGLMIGVELGKLARSPSRLLRVLGEQNLLGFLASGWLLREEKIRVAPTLSSHGTIRLEPSAFIEEAELDHFVAAFERLLRILKDARVDVLLGGPPPPESARATIAAAVPPPLPSVSTATPHAAFLAHFLEPGDLRSWEPRLAAWSDHECEDLLDRTMPVLEPFDVKAQTIRSATGAEVNLHVVGVPLLPAQVIRAMREGKEERPLELVRLAVERARATGARVVGFGGYTSIVSRSCTAFVEDELALTSGNSLTAAAALDALFSTAASMGIEPSRARLGVVGGAGNLGAVLAEVAADRVPEIVLIGRPAAESRLADTAASIYESALRRLARGGEAAAYGVARALADLPATRELMGPETRTPRPVLAGSGARLYAALARSVARDLAERAPVRLATDMAELRSCTLILSATNAPRPVIKPEHIGDAPVVIADVATPRDVDPAVIRERPRARVLSGGLVSLPAGQAIDLGGLPLAPGQVHGCLAETLLLGLERAREHFSYGPLRADNVRRAAELARKHGFLFAPQLAAL